MMQKAVYYGWATLTPDLFLMELCSKKEQDPSVKLPIQALSEVEDDLVTGKAGGFPSIPQCQKDGGEP